MMNRMDALDVTFRSSFRMVKEVVVKSVAESSLLLCDVVAVVDSDVVASVFSTVDLLLSPITDVFFCDDKYLQPKLKV